MNILLGYPIDLFFRNGGVQNQIMSTYYAFKGLGHNVFLLSDFIIDKNIDIDIYHQFTLDQTQIKIFSEIKKREVKTVISPIYNSDLNFFKRQFNIVFFKKTGWSLNGYKERFEMINCAHGLVYLGPREKKLIESQYGRVKESVIVPNGIHEIFKSSLISNRANENKNYILHIGSFYRLKNQLELIKACKELNVNLKLVGPILDEKYYETCKKEAQNFPNIEFIGPIEPNSKELVELYQNAKLFILPSSKEVFPLSVLEALSQGTKVISTINSELKDYITDNNAISFLHTTDKNEISKAIIENIKIEENKYDFDFELFNWKNIGSQLISFYSKIINI